MANHKRIYSEEEIKGIVEYYKNHTLKETARKFHSTTTNAKKVLLSQGVKLRLKTRLKGNICNRCKRAARFIEFPCPWASKFEPVEGWTAEETTLNFASAKNLITYHITKCPLFMADDERSVSE